MTLRNNSKPEVTTMSPLQAKPAIIAHRGACGYLPEHTLQGVELAHQQGAHFIEQDVVLTGDGIPIVLHDITLELTTNVAVLFPKRRQHDGKFYCHDFTLKEIQSLTAHERTDSEGRRIFPGRHAGPYDAFKVPTLAEELSLIDSLNAKSDHQAGVYIELKQPEHHERLGADLFKAVYDVLKRFDRLNDPQSTVIQCFDPETLKRFKNEGRFSSTLIQLICEGMPADLRGDFDRMQTTQGIGEISQYADGIGPHIPLLFDRKGEPSEMVTAAKNLGLFLHPFTLRADSASLDGVNFTELHKKLFVDLQVDGAFTDFSDKTRDLIRQLEI